MYFKIVFRGLPITVLVDNDGTVAVQRDLNISTEVAEWLTEEFYTDIQDIALDANDKAKAIFERDNF